MAEGDPVQFTKENECHVILNRGDIFYTPKNKNGYKCITHEFKIELNKINSGSFGGNTKTESRRRDMRSHKVGDRNRGLMENVNVDIKDILEKIIQGLNKA